MRHVAIAAWDWPAFEGGGVAALCQSLAVGLVAEGVRVTVWTRGGGDRDAALARAPEVAGVRIVAFPGRSWRRRGTDHWRRGVARAVRHGVPDAVIVGSIDALPGVVQGLGLRSAQVACIAHGRDITADLPAARDGVRRAALALPGVLWLGLTHWMADQLTRRGVPADRVRRVPAGVPPPPTQTGPRRGPVTELLTVGRLIPRKGHDVLLTAWPRLRAEHPALVWHIVGDGPQREVVERRAASLSGVVVHGELPAPALESRWGSADLFVMPCREAPGGDTEGYGLVFMEAAARGVLAVGGATAGAAEAVQAVGGEPIADPSAPDVVAASLLALLAEPSAVRHRGVQARRRWLAGGQPAHMARAVLDALRHRRAA